MSKHQHLGLLRKGETAVITGISPDCKIEIKQRLLDLGFVKGTEIVVQNISPLKDPVAYSVHDTQISLRKENSCHIFIEIKDNQNNGDKGSLQSL
jgi:ferrous iron transport protein A